MRVLCLGDVVGAPGRELLVERLPAVIAERAIDFVVVNAENIADGAGVDAVGFRALRAAGADVLTTGDHVFRRADILKLFKKHGECLLRPANYPAEAAGAGSTVVTARDGTRVGVMNLVGRVFMDPSDNPFDAADRELAALAEQDAQLIIVDFHAEATSEKRAMAWHLDGRAALLFGTHTHVPTADEEILPQGMAYVSDIGMCGGFASVIGRHADNVLLSMRTRMYAPFSVSARDTRGSGIVVEVDPATGRATAIERLWIRP